jgi:hypothetical protein
MTERENERLVNQLHILSTFLPRLSAHAEFTRLRLIYERGGTHMLNSENAQRLVDAAFGHVQELRKLARQFALECHLNLAQRPAPRQE